MIGASYKMALVDIQKLNTDTIAAALSADTTGDQVRSGER
jgi:hypothetical protein